MLWFSVNLHDWQLLYCLGDYLYSLDVSANIKIALLPSSRWSEGSRGRVFENLIKFIVQYNLHVKYAYGLSFGSTY